MTDYQIVFRTNVVDLVVEVKRLMAAGWITSGGVSASGANATGFYQAMTKA